MLRKTPLKRSKKPLNRGGRIKPSRSKPRPGRLKGADMVKLRDEAYERDMGLCVTCGKRVNLEAPIIADNSMHLAHRKNKRMHGDHIGNVDTQCGECHRKYHNCGPSMQKVVPPKPKML